MDFLDAGHGGSRMDVEKEKPVQQKSLRAAMNEDDISARANVFRSELLEEFRVLESGIDPKAENTPRYDSNEITAGILLKKNTQCARSCLWFISFCFFLCRS